MIRKFGVWVFAICLAGMLSSCIFSENPLGDKADSVIDADLPGIWYAESNDDPKVETYLAIYQDTDGTLEAFAFDNDGGVPRETYRGYINKIGDDNYVSLNIVKDGKAGKEYIPVYYVINQNNQLEISTFRKDFFEKAIKAGKIQGKVSKMGFPTVEASTANFVEFIKSSNKEEFLDKDAKIVLDVMKKWIIRSETPREDLEGEVAY